VETSRVTEEKHQTPSLAQTLHTRERTTIQAIAQWLMVVSPNTARQELALPP
jgi:hypothetical protein